MKQNHYMARIIVKTTKSLSKGQKKKVIQGLRRTLLKIAGGSKDETTVIINETGKWNRAFKNDFSSSDGTLFLKRMCYLYARD